MTTGPGQGGINRWLSRPRTWFALFALVVASAGYWGPWVAHKDVALILIGQDMGEFVKFLPEAQDGSIGVIRQFFYLPPFCVCVLLALFAANRALHFGALWRTLFLLAILPISLALLPPVVSIPVLKSEEFRLQIIGLGVCWILIPTTKVLVRLPVRLLSVAMIPVALLGAIPAIWQVWVVWPAITRTYAAPLHVGWGLPAVVIGFLALAALGLLITIR